MSLTELLLVERWRGGSRMVGLGYGRKGQSLIVYLRLAIRTLVICLALDTPLFAQAWEVDARSVGVGGIGGSQNVFATTVDEQRGDHSIVVPLGVIQLLLNRSTLDPGSRDFDPVRAIEYGADPVHFMFGRNGSDSGASFVSAIRNGALQPDLNAYRGFVPANLTAGGLVAPKWGHTFYLPHHGDRVQGIYVGGGPHLTLETTLNVDDGLSRLLESATATYAVNQRFGLADRSRGQGAAAAVGGYRGEFPLHRNAGVSQRKDALYVAVNANYLWGFRYEDVDLHLQFDTDQRGLLSSSGGVNAAPPFDFTRLTSSRGSGFALDLATGVTIGPWEMGLSASEVGNTMMWHGVTQRQYSLANLFSGTGEFNVTPAIEIGDVRVHVPVNYRGNASYRGEHWSALAEIDRSWDNVSFRAGLEQRLRRSELRGGVGYSQGQWLPSAGVSQSISPRFWIDLAAFSSNTNVERRTRYAVALSLRFSPSTP